jgi:hypothetical protein
MVGEGRSLRILVLLALVVFLAGAPAASAKGMAEICGGAGCATPSDPGVVGSLRSTFEAAPAPAPAPFFLVRFCGGTDGTDCRGPSEWSYLYVPSAKAMRADNIGSGPVHWMNASLLSSLLDDLTRDLEPYPASPTWARTAASPDKRSPLVWVAAAAVAVVALTLIGLARRRRTGRSAVVRPTRSRTTGS